MKLSSAREGQVVRNVGNGSHYRYERPEKGRVRIFPLEVFPNGLLIAKPTPTIVDPGLEVVLVGSWEDGMRVEAKPTYSRNRYELELRGEIARLTELREAYIELPVNGTGKQSRGSWANKIKNCEARIATIRRGLGDVQDTALTVEVAVKTTRFKKHDVVQVPSGLPAQVQSVRGSLAVIETRYKGQKVTATVPADVLTPWHLARVATV